MHLSRRLFLVAAAFSATLLSSCNKDKGAEKIKIGIVTNNPADFWTIAEKGAKDAAEKHGVELIFRRPEKADAVIQRDLVNELVRQGVSGLAVSVINPEEQTPDLKGIAKQVNLITMDNDAEDSGRLCYIGTDNYVAGKAAGMLVKEAMPQGGTVAIFVGSSTALNARQRFQGVVDELAGTKDAKGPTYGKYTLYKNAVITDNGAGTAQENAKDALAALSGTENLCMVGLWAYNAPAILEAARSKKMVDKIRIVSFDEYTATLDAIEKGEIYATVVQDPYNFGYKSVEILAEIAKTGDKSKIMKDAVPHRIIAKEASNGRLAAKQFAIDLNKLLGK